MLASPARMRTSDVPLGGSLHSIEAAPECRLCALVEGRRVVNTAAAS